MTRIVWIRHGETEANNQHLFQGRGDICGVNTLNKRGIEQVALTAAMLDALPLDPHVIYSSTLRRARQSAIIIAGRFPYGIIYDQRLVERNYGAYEGECWATADPDFVKRDRSTKFDYSDVGGESGEEMYHRIRSVLLHIANHYEGKTVFVVAHAGVIRFGLAILGIEPESRFPNSGFWITDL